MVLYGDHNNWFAAWGVWVFNYYGHNNVKLMDGGRTTWEKERRPLSTNPATPRRTNYRVTEVRHELRARLPDVLDVAEGNVTAALLDIRSPDEYNGRIIAPAGIQELSVRAGHVPGAVNVPYPPVTKSKTTTVPGPNTATPSASPSKTPPARSGQGNDDRCAQRLTPRTHGAASINRRLHAVSAFARCPSSQPSQCRPHPVRPS